MRCESCALINKRKKNKDNSRRRRSDDAIRTKINERRRRTYRNDPDARARRQRANVQYHKAHPEVSDVFSRAAKREAMRQRRKDRDFIVRTCLRRREVAELKRRGLWPTVQSLPPHEIPQPRRKLDRVALAARTRRARAKTGDENAGAFRQAA
jgi:hypothetical protein